MHALSVHYAGKEDLQQIWICKFPLIFQLTRKGEGAKGRADAEEFSSILGMDKCSKAEKEKLLLSVRLTFPLSCCKTKCFRKE